MLTELICSFFTTHTQVTLALLTEGCQRLHRVGNLNLGSHFVDQSNLLLVKDAVRVRNVVVRTLILVILNVD